MQRRTQPGSHACKPNYSTQNSTLEARRRCGRGGGRQSNRDHSRGSRQRVVRWVPLRMESEISDLPVGYDWDQRPG